MNTVNDIEPDQCSRCYLLGWVDYYPDPGGEYFCEAHCFDNATQAQWKCMECLLSFLADNGECPFFIHVDNRHAKKVK